MYHRVHGLGRVPGAMATHLQYLKDHYPIVLPGHNLVRQQLNVCLTFDDATVDFYSQVFPILERLDMQAVLGVPTAWIGENSSLSIAQRLRLQDQSAYNQKPAGLCTWSELKLMQASNLVVCAAHGHNHLNMNQDNVNITEELILSRNYIEQRLGSYPTTFIYPYGRTQAAIQRQVHTIFPYAMRIGHALNHSWSGNLGLLYRVDAEKFWPDGHTWSITHTLHWRLKYWLNRLRNK